MAAVAIVASQAASSRGGGFLDDLTSKDTHREQLIVRELTRQYGFAWRDFNKKGQEQKDEFQHRMASNARMLIQGGEVARPWSEISVKDRREPPDRPVHGSGLQEGGKGGEPTVSRPKVPRPKSIDRKHPVQIEVPVLAQFDPALFTELEMLGAQQQALQLSTSGQALLTTKQRIDLLLNDPESGPWAFRVAVVILTTICVSCVAILIESLPEFANNNSTADTVFFIVDTFCVAIFTVEFFARLWCCTSKIAFLKQPMNVIDLLAIVPYYVDVLASVEIGWLTILRMLRMVRLLRFAQKNESVACVIHTLEQSRDIAAFMIFMLTIVVIVFASFAYNVEQGNWDNTLGCYVRPGESFCSPFVSIPQAMWWCIVTVMMVGYGDIVPTTIPGKIFASIACVTGVLAVALPVSVLGANFSTKMVAHRNQVKKQQAIDRARKQGINGVVQSRARVLQALRSFNNANSNTLELGNVAVRETISMHHRTWTEYLKSFSSCPKALESLQGTATIDPVTGMRSVEMVARIGKPELFSCLEQDIFREIDMGLSEVFSLIEDTADIAQRMRKKIEYINWLKQNTNVQLESHWETVQQQVEETRQVCERMASSMQNDPVTGVTTPKSRKSHKGD